MDPVMTALRLGAPNLVRAEGPRPNNETGPTWSIVHYEFPRTSTTTDRFKMTWYDGAQLPPRDLFQLPKDQQLLKNGILFMGSKGQLLVDYFNSPVLLPLGDFADTRIEAAPIDNHYTQWTDAIVGHGKTSCPFSYAGPLTETVLLGNVAIRAGRKIMWDAARLDCIGDTDATALLRRDYRAEWDVPGLGRGPILTEEDL